MHHEDRSARARPTSRRVRRLARRARAFAPVLAVPAIFGLLALTMNLIEYRPTRRVVPDASAAPSEALHAPTAGARRAAEDRAADGDTRPPGAMAASVIDGVLATGVTAAGSDWLESASRTERDARDPARTGLREGDPAAATRLH